MSEQQIDHVQAERIARAHPALASLDTRRSRAVLVQRPPARGDKLAASGHVLVGFYDYETNQALIALVDPKTEQVVRVEKAVAPFQLNDAERHEAEQLAAADVRVQAFLGGREPHPLTRLYFPQRLPAELQKHRFAIVFLRPRNTERRYAVVDLSAATVADLLTRHDLTGR